ncbi:transcription factor IIF subunit tfg1 [Coemansia sp. RSA 988]|nr:transcription factor IIF subunit tfg1 [Coemansia sp. RSA 988]
MSSGIRRPAKKTGGSFGIRTSSVRQGQSNVGIRRTPGQQRPQMPSTGEADIPLATATGISPSIPNDNRTSTDYTLMSTTRNQTHNVMRFLSSKPVELTSFTPPVKMRRRNREYYRLKNKKRNEERQAQLEQGGSDQKQNNDDKMDIQLSEKDERPKADMNLIADVGGARRNKRNLFKKRTKQVFFANEDKRRLDIEEARPWVLEDDDEKEVWTGSLEGGQNSAFVLFVLADDGFKVVPVDRWYKFTPKLKYKTLTLDEAEEELQRLQKSHATHDRWLMHRRNPQNGDETDGAAAGASEKDADGMAGQGQQQPSLVEYEVDDLASDLDEDDDGGGGSGRRPKKQGNKHGGIEEIEFEMEFDDDEELGDVRFEFNEEEENEKKERMGKEHSTMFGSEDEGEEEDTGRSQGSKDLDKDAKAVRKLMRKREGNNEYESDREENPYLSESELDSDESDEETAQAKEQDQQQSEKPSGTPEAGTQQKQEQLSPRPASGANPAAAGGSSSAKKRKRLSTTPHQHHGTKKAGEASAAGSAGTPSQTGSEPRKHFKTSGSSSKSAASTLITKQDIVDLIRNGVSTTKELIGHVRKKLKANPENKSRIQAILKEVATFKNNQLALKKP